MERNEITHIDGREFVTVKEFARREDVSEMTIEKKIKLGIIPVVYPDRKKKRYIDWELGDKAFNMNPPNRKNVEAQRLVKRKKKEDTYAKAKESAGSPSVSSPSIPSIEDESIRKEKLIDISEIDPKLLEDCKVNGTVDWDLAKKKLTAMTYAYDLDIKKGKYIDKAEVQMWALTLAKILESNLSSIPNRYASILEAEVVSMVRKITGKTVNLTDEIKSKMRERMENVAPEIFRSIQESLEKFNDEE
jgi:hypothetical protein